ncbi:MAG: universal stress protein [Pseudomonadota bacterium]
MKAKSILVVVDPTGGKEQFCVEKGAKLAEIFDAKLELLICFYDQHLSGERFFDSKGLRLSREDAIKNRSIFLENLAVPLRNHGLEVKTTALWDTPLDDAIVRYAVESEADLVVKDTHYHGALSRALFTNTDWGLIRNCPVPLLLSKPTAWAENPAVIAAVDPLHTHDKPAELDAKILGAADAITSKISGDLHVFHSYPLLAHRLAVNPELLGDSLNEIDKSMEKEHQQALDDLLRQNAISKSTNHLLSGDPSRVLPDVADGLSASMVVMGAVSRKPVQRVFLGSTAERVMDRLSCDLLVIKPNWFKVKVDFRDVDLIQTKSESAAA